MSETTSEDVEALAEACARELYLELMQETRDEWPLWGYLPPEVKKGWMGRGQRLADTLAAHVAKVRAEALREAAVDFEAGQRKASRRTGDLHPWVAVTDWLRARADRIEGGER